MTMSEHIMMLFPPFHLIIIIVTFINFIIIIIIGIIITYGCLFLKSIAMLQESKLSCAAKFLKTKYANGLFTNSLSHLFSK